MSNDNNISLKFKYMFPNDYNPVYINGIYGGLSPRGEIVANFFLERSPLPYTETITIDDKGQIIAGGVTEPPEHNINVIRYVSTGIVMSLENAKSFHQWLGQHIQQLEERSDK